jgi:hypothetical protein
MQPTYEIAPAGSYRPSTIAPGDWDAAVAAFRIE